MKTIIVLWNDSENRRGQNTPGFLNRFSFIRQRQQVLAMSLFVGLFLVNFSLNAATDENSVRASIGSATYLELQNNSEVARQILKTVYQASKQITLLSHWLAMDEAKFQQLKQKQQRHSIYHWEAEFENKCLNERHYGWHCSEYDRHKELVFQEGSAIPTVTIEEVRGLLDKYNQLKSSLIEIQRLLSDPSLKTDEVAKIKEMSRKHQTLVDEVKRTRYDYLSFDVISPYLARTEQLVFISRIDKPEVGSPLTFLPDNSLKKLRAIETLREAAKMFAFVADQEILFDSHSTIREQFVRVYKKFKKTAGPAHFDEFEPIKVIASQLKKEPNLGAERWWK